MKKQIIVNIDPLNIQHNIVEYAIHLARRLDLPLLLYSVQQHTVMPVAADTGGQAPSLRELPPDWENTVKQKAEDYCEEVKRSYPNTSFEHDLGLLTDSLHNKLDYLYRSAEKRSPYLLIMPKNATYSWWNDVVGTAETAMAAESPCPVLFVPESAQLGRLERILYLTDQDALKNYKYPGFEMLNVLSVHLQAKIIAGFMAENEADHPFYNSGAAMEMLRLSLPNQTNHEFRFFNDLNADQILDMAKLTRSDLIAFPFREAGILERFFEQEVTRELVLKSDIPTLVF